VIALSYTGNTEEIAQLLRSLKSRKIPVISLCGKAESRLARESDVWLDASVVQEACPHNLAPTSSTTLALVIGDALAVSLMKVRGFDARAFAQNHPGGSLGRRLSLHVSAIMHPANEVATVGPDASMDEVVVEGTHKNLGAVLVVQEGKLLGLITDGDLRRALKKRELFFDLKAKEVMTSSPITIRADQLAYDALEIMENRPSQIKELPVVNGEGVVLGLVRLHDLVRAF
jgi:arabinose-5-phosphate isomerase